MEFFGAFFDQEWDSLSNIFSFEDSDSLFASEDHNNYNFNYNNNNNNNNNNDVFFPSCDHPIVHNTHFYSASQESSNNSSEIETIGNGGFSHEGAFEPMDFILPAVFSDEIRQLKAKTWCEKSSGEVGDSVEGMQLKRKFVETEETHNLPHPPKKTARISKEANKTKRSPRSKSNKKSEVQAISIDEQQANDNVVANGQSSSTCSSEQGDSNELINGGSNGKSKAGKSPATDSQSIYARKRRERINERLKILQTLVPNGTKVDISTMLEEAVDYVKFLQLQIKLLSSDDMWMYAPIAYNGMDMGLYQKIVPNL